METEDAINRAITSHAIWKQRLRNAIDTSSSEFIVARAKPDNLCDFGKWLYSFSTSDQKSENWQIIKELHAKFHVEAASVLDLALKGNKQEAEKAFSFGSEFTKISMLLTSAMMKWKNSIS